MTSRTLRTCLGFALAALLAGTTRVSLGAQAGSAATPAPPAQKKAVPASVAKQAATAPASATKKTPAPPAAAPRTAPAASAQPKTAATAAKKTPAAGQQAAAPAAQTPAVVPASPVPAVVERPASAESYTYRSEGRRDPFISLVNRASIEKGPPQKRPDGLRGLSFDEISLRGVFLGRSGPIALVQGPDTKTYQVHVGDRMFDAVVKTITPDSLVVLQEVNDPLSLQKQRERRKSLRVAEEVK